MDFNSLLSKTWKEFESNFSSIIKSFGLLYAIPTYLAGLCFMLWFYFGSAYSFISKMVSSENISLNGAALSGQMLDWLKQNYSVFVLFIALWIVVWLLSLIAKAGLISSSLKKQKYSLADIVSSGKRNLFRYIAFWIFLFVIMLLFALIEFGIWKGFGGSMSSLSEIALLLLIALVLFVLLVYLFVYLSMGLFAYLDGKEGLFASLKKGWNITKGRWWKLLGYSLLVMLLYLLFSIIFSVVSGIISIIIGFIGNSLGVLFVKQMISSMFSILRILVSTPFLLLFFKNVYLDWKK